MRRNRIDEDFDAKSRYSTNRRHSSVPRSARSNPDSVVSKGDEYNQQEYLRDEKLKLAYDIKKLLKEVKPLRQKLYDTQEIIMSKNEYDKVYLQEFTGDAEQIMQRREKSAQIVQLQRQCDAITDECEQMRIMFSNPSLTQLSHEIATARKEVYDLKEQTVRGQRKLIEIEKKIAILTTSDYYSDVQDQRAKIAELKLAIEMNKDQYEENKQLEQKYLAEIKQVKSAVPDVMRRQKGDSKSEVAKLEKILAQKQAALAEAQSRYNSILEAHALELERARTAPVTHPKQRAVKFTAVSNPVNDEYDESFSDQEIQELVVAVGLFRKEVSENEVRALFSRYGAINGIRVYPKMGTRPQAYFAKVAFYDHYEASHAIEKMNGKTYDGFRLSVKWAKDQGFCAGNAKTTKRRIDPKKLFPEVTDSKPAKKRVVMSAKMEEKTVKEKTSVVVEPIQMETDSSSSLDFDAETGNITLVPKQKSVAPETKKGGFVADVISYDPPGRQMNSNTVVEDTKAISLEDPEIVEPVEATKQDDKEERIEISQTKESDVFEDVDEVKSEKKSSSHSKSSSSSSVQAVDEVKSEKKSSSHAKSSSSSSVQAVDEVKSEKKSSSHAKSSSSSSSSVEDIDEVKSEKKASSSHAKSSSSSSSSLEDIDVFEDVDEVKSEKKASSSSEKPKELDEIKSEEVKSEKKTSSSSSIEEIQIDDEKNDKQEDKNPSPLEEPSHSSDDEPKPELPESSTSEEIKIDSISSDNPEQPPKQSSEELVEVPESDPPKPPVHEDQKNSTLESDTTLVTLDSISELGETAEKKEEQVKHESDKETLQLLDMPVKQVVETPKAEEPAPMKPMFGKLLSLNKPLVQDPAPVTERTVTPPPETTTKDSDSESIVLISDLSDDNDDKKPEEVESDHIEIEEFASESDSNDF